ncbi:MAG: hypothetical protein U5L45_23490 [Saprospiraceae bacterium]|nr:hypothetical protein [Saprospiraceae bacterium]
MKNLNIRTLFLSIIGSLGSYLGCVRTDPTPPTDYLKYPLDVKAVELPDGSVRLSWNAIKSADFLEYRVIKNTGDSVPYIEGEAIKTLNKVSPNLELAKLTENADSTFFVDSFSIPATKTFLRVFAVLKGRNISSRNVEMSVKTDAKEMLLNPNDVLYIPEDRRIVIADKVNSKLGIFDIPTNNPLSITPNITFNANTEIAYGRWNNQTELYIPNNFQLTVRNLNTNVNTTFLPFFAFDGLFYEKTKNVLFTVRSQPATILLTSRAALTNTFNSFSTYAQFTFSTQRVQTLYSLRQAPANNEAIALSITNNNADVIWFKYDAAVQNVTKVGGLNTFLINITKRPFAIAPDNQGFITSGKGLIFNRNMALIDSLKLPEPEIRYPDMIFSNDKAFLYAVRNAVERREKYVDVYAYPTYKFVRSIPFKSTPLRIFQDGEYLILVGRSPNTPLKTMIEKVKL